MTATVLQCDREALKPCPFCGAAGKIIAPLGSGNIRAGNCSTDNCHASGPWGKDEAAAITAWNTRHDSTSEMVEALKLAHPIVEADLETAQSFGDGDWIGMSQTALDAINATLQGTDR